MAYASLALALICPFPWPTLLGFYWAESLAPLLAGHFMAFGRIQQIRCRSIFAISSKTIKSLTALRIPTLQHVSSNMQSPPHDTSRGYSYQRHHQSSLSSTHSPTYMDHAPQPVAYHPVVQNAQVQRSTYGHPQDHHHQGTPPPSPIPVNFH